MDSVENRRNALLDAWDYRVPFGKFHIYWGEGDITPAFEQEQAYAILLQDTNLKGLMDIWAHREVLVTFSSEYIQVGAGPAEREPAWVVVAAGLRRLDLVGSAGFLERISPGGGAVVQALVHARTGEVLLGTAIPAELQRRA